MPFLCKSLKLLRVISVAVYLSRWSFYIFVVQTQATVILSQRSYVVDTHIYIFIPKIYLEADQTDCTSKKSCFFQFPLFFAVISSTCSFVMVRHSMDGLVDRRNTRLQF